MTEIVETEEFIVNLPVTRLYPSSKVPTYAYQGDAGLDLYSAERGTINPGDRLKVSTGISIAIPNGFAGLIVPRSGLSVRHGITVLNSPGIVDSGYRGEIQVVLINLGKERFVIGPGAKIAQLLLVEVPYVRTVRGSTTENEETEENGKEEEGSILRVHKGSEQAPRGSLGFGSSG